MKNRLFYLAAVYAALFCSCTTVTTRTTAPDGTVTEVTTTSVDPTAFAAGANAVTSTAAIIAAKQAEVVVEK